MDLPAILPYLSGPVGAVVVLVWMVWLQRKDIADLRRTIEAERHRADSAEEAARTANQLIAGVLERSRNP